MISVGIGPCTYEENYVTWGDPDPNLFKGEKYFLAKQIWDFCWHPMFHLEGITWF